MSARALAELIAIVTPPACAACRGPTARADVRLCADCLRSLPWLPRHVCPRCALPRHRRGCPAAGAAFAAAWAPLAYDGVARSLVAALKFRGALSLATLMAAHVAANLPPGLAAGGAPGFAPGLAAGAAPGLAADVGPGHGVGLGSGLAAPVTAVVAVPPQRARARVRGFDAAAVLAAALAPRLGLSVRRCLARRDRGPRQVGSSRAQRRRGGRIGVGVCGPVPRRALLVDDVHTTGATLDACARALLADGCGEVVAVTYARAL